jgi:hypothetical protein
MVGENSLSNCSLPLIIVDYSILNHYKENLFSEEPIPAIKRFTRNLIVIYVRRGECIAVVPFTHNKRFVDLKSNRYEIDTFLPVCHIFPENTNEFEHAPIFTASVCEVKYPRRPRYILTLDSKTKQRAEEQGYNVITVEQATEIIRPFLT